MAYRLHPKWMLILVSACAGPSTPTVSLRQAPHADDECRPSLSARRDGKNTLVVNVIASRAIYYSSDTTITGGQLEAAFGEAGIPTWFIKLDESGRATMTLETLCHERTTFFVVALDVNGEQITTTLTPK